jgi:hypothetical protein
MSSADVVLAMHGAALTHMYWLGRARQGDRGGQGKSNSASPAGAEPTSAAVIELFPFGLHSLDWYGQIADTLGGSVGPGSRLQYYSWTNRERGRAVFQTEVVKKEADRMRAMGDSKAADMLPAVLTSEVMDSSDELSQLHFKNQDTVVDVAAVAALVLEAVLGVM